jgi:hypothetical protein
LTDSQLDQAFRVARHSRRVIRAVFLQAVASMLDSDQPDDGAVFRACREAQRMFFDPPDLSHATDQSSRRPGR